MTTSQASRSVGAACALFLVGCGGPAADAHDGDFVVRDSAGVTVAESLAPAWGVGEGWELSAEPAVSIGVVSGPDEYQLFRVADAMRLRDGRIVVLNGGTRDVRFYGPDGLHLRTVGGAGQGPEEYRYPMRVFQGAGDSVVVQDFMDRVFYAANGDFGRRASLSTEAWWQLFQPEGFAEGASWLPDGTILTPVYPASRSTPRPGPLLRPPMTYVRVSGDLTSVDTLGLFGGIEQQLMDVGSRVMPVVPPFAASSGHRVGRDGTILLVDGALPEANRYEPDGRHVILRWVAQREPVTPAEVETWKEEARSASWVEGQLPELERAWAEMDVPPFKPYSTGFGLPTRDGGTWVRVRASSSDGLSPSTWFVFDADGRWLGPLVTPAGFQATDVGSDYVLGVLRDPDTDVETVALYDLEKR